MKDLEKHLREVRTLNTVCLVCMCGLVVLCALLLIADLARRVP